MINIYRLDTTYRYEVSRIPRKLKKKWRKQGLMPGRIFFGIRGKSFFKDIWGECQECGSRLNLEFECINCPVRYGYNT